MIRTILYARLSRDDDVEQESLNNQEKILTEYANDKGYKIIDVIKDDNISGMTFEREGIDKIREYALNHEIDLVLVKDMSRLGRNKTYTALFIDFLKKNNINVHSVTENLDTNNENDDLIIGFKGLFNDMYARDISRKVRAGMDQKLKNGLIITPPMGYFKDKNTKQIVIVNEQADIIRLIFQMYLGGYGFKAIAKHLNEKGIKSPSYYHKKMYGTNVGSNKPKIAHKFLWDHSAIKKVLQNEFYIGIVYTHKTYNDKINGIRRNIALKDQYKHKDIVPSIINKDDFYNVQTIIDSKKRKVKSNNKPCRRYAGLLECGDCGSTFVGVIRRWRNKPERIEYKCNGYHRYGKKNCSSHLIREEVLDDIIYEKLIELKEESTRVFNSIDKEVKSMLKEKIIIEDKVNRLESEIVNNNENIKSLLLNMIKDKENEQYYIELISELKDENKKLSIEINAIKNYNDTVKKRKSELKNACNIIEKVLSERKISDTNLRLIIEKIIIYEREGKLDIELRLKAHISNTLEEKIIELFSC